MGSSGVAHRREVQSHDEFKPTGRRLLHRLGGSKTDDGIELDNRDWAAAGHNELDRQASWKDLTP